MIAKACIRASFVSLALALLPAAGGPARAWSPGDRAPVVLVQFEPEDGDLDEDWRSERERYREERRERRREERAWRREERRLERQEFRDLPREERRRRREELRHERREDRWDGQRDEPRDRRRDERPGFPDDLEVDPEPDPFRRAFPSEGRFERRP